MNMRKALVTAMVGSTLALSGIGATAAPMCSTIVTIGAWAAAGSCDQGDKEWTLNSSVNLGAGVGVIFSFIGDTYAMQLVGFDTSSAAGTWNLNYTIAVTNPLFNITDMFAGADNPGGGSLLTKSVTGDAAFTLTVVNGVEDAGSEKHLLTALTLTVDENFSVDAGKTLLSVSDTFTQTRIPQVPLPGTLALFGLGLVALGAVRRIRRSS